QPGLQRAEFLLREVFGGADPVTRLELALQVRSAEADRGGEFVQRGFAAVEQGAGAFEFLVLVCHGPKRSGRTRRPLSDSCRGFLLPSGEGAQRACPRML